MAEAPPFPHRLFRCWLRRNSAARWFENRARMRCRHGPAATTPDRPIPLVHAMPRGDGNRAGPQAPPADLTGPGSGSRSLSEVPRFYRSRLDANRSSQASTAAPAPPVSRLSRRALDWLSTPSGHRRSLGWRYGPV